MYDYPVLFPVSSNRATWLQTVQICDDDTGDLISLTDAYNNPIYQIYLEISPPRGHGEGHGYGPYSNPYYGNEGEPLIYATLADYIAIIGTGTIQIQIPYTIMQKMRGGRTYDVYLRLEDAANDDARQLFIGKLPLAFGGRGI